MCIRQVRVDGKDSVMEMLVEVPDEIVEDPIQVQEFFQQMFREIMAGNGYELPEYILEYQIIPLH